MELFTWWDARGRRLPWLIALVLVLGSGYAAADAVAVVSVNKVFLKSTRDAHEKCAADVLVSRGVWQCEGWWGGSCKRPWLGRPNYVSCGGVEAFWDKWDGSDSHRKCSRRSLYYAGPNGTSALKLVKVGSGGKRWATSAWACTRYSE